MCTQNIFQLMGMGVTVGVFMFMFVYIIEPIDAELEEHDLLPAHREAEILLSEVLKQSLRAELKVEENARNIDKLSDNILILNEKVTNIQQQIAQTNGFKP